MRIGIDCKNILNVSRGEFAGVGHYTYYLVKNLLKLDKTNTYVLFFYDLAYDVNQFEGPNVEIVQMPLFRYKKYLPFVFSHLIVPFVYYRHKLDLLHYPAPIRPLGYFKKMIVTVHDLAPYRNPEWFPEMSRFFTGLIMPAGLKMARRIIAVSESTKDDLYRFFQIPAERVSVIYEGVPDYSEYKIKEENVREAIKRMQNFFLFIGTIEPRKNILNLLKAFELFCEQHPEKNMRLVIAGKQGWKHEPVTEYIEQMKFKDRVHILGYVTHDEKVMLYRNAFALTYPSFFEGFGLQLLEAMNVGLPIITTNEGAIAEVVLDNAILVEPHDSASIADGMSRLVSDDKLRNDLIKKGLGIAENFTWEECAKGTIIAYDKAK